MNVKTKFKLQVTNLILLCCMLSSTLLWAQQPVVLSVKKNTGSMAQIISIAGSNFGTDKTKLTVFFGAAKATILNASDQLLEVKAPNGATFDHVSVTRDQATAPGLAGSSDDQFLLSFGGNGPFDVNNLETQQDFPQTIPAEKGLYDLCMCDFDGDNDTDIATASLKSNNISILFNSSTPGLVKFKDVDIKTLAIGGNSIHVKCGDLNGDGKADLVATEGDLGNRIYILQNMGGGVFTQQTLVMPLNAVLQIRIVDLDLDGKPDLVASHFDTSSPKGILWVIKNQTVSSTISFATPLTVEMNNSAATTTDALDVVDLNGDHYPELVTSLRFASVSSIFVVENKSTPGSLAFGSAVKALDQSYIINLKFADVDGDGKPDLITSQFFPFGGLNFALNQSSGSSISFATPLSIPSDINQWGFDVGDLDGDGKPDIVSSSSKIPNLTILNNTSSVGAISFTKSLKPMSSLGGRHVSIGDLDGDGKPDIAFTSIDDIANTGQKISVFRNKTCMIPQVTPASFPVKICTGATPPVTLSTIISGGASYTWSDGSNGSSLTVPVAVASSTSYSLVVSPQAGGIVCPTPSNSVLVDVVAGSATGVISITPADPVAACVGTTLSLKLNDGSPANHKYVWRGPDGFTFTGNPATLSNFQVANAGKYVVDVVDNTTNCFAQQTSAIVEATDAQNFKVLFSGADVICQGDPKKILMVNPPASSYDWYKGSTKLNRTYDTLQVSSTGEYYAKLTTSCGAAETPKVKITVASIPAVDFISDPAVTACQGQNVQFTNKSTGLSSDLTPTYKWDFGDASTSTDENPKHNYSTPLTPTVTFTVSYNGVCSGNKTSTALTIQSAPSAQIVNPDTPGQYEFCDGESINLKVPGSFVSYLWSTGESTSSISVTKAGNYTVEVKTASCTLNAEQAVTTITPLVAIGADPTQIEEGQTAQLTASGLQNYVWSPAESLTNAAIANPVASPVVTTTYSVTGTDDKGCTGNATFQLLVKGEPIVNKLGPSNFFSPNKDNTNDSWKINKIVDYPQCNVAIYDDKGIKVFEAKPYTEEWDGTMKGKRLPDGVYYYIIRCDGEESKPRSGSITLLR